MNTPALADMAAADHEDGYQNAPVGLLSLDGELRLHRINDTLLRWLGRERSELSQFNREGLADFPDLAGVLNERSISMLRNHVQGLPRNGTAATIELSVFGGSGQFFKVELCSTGVFDARGNLRYTNTSVIDVSARSEIEHRLRARVDMLQMLTDRTPSQLAYYDKNLICHFSNAAHAASYGREPADLVGQHLSEIVSPAVLPEIIPKVAKALSGERLQFEAQRLTSDGKSRFYDIRYLPDFADERVMGYFVELVDITDRRRTEDFVFNANLDLEERMALRTAELRRSEQRYHLVTETVREYGILFLGVDGAINDWTESARRLHGFDPSEVMGRGLDALLMDADPASQVEGTSDASALLQRCIEAGHAEGANWCARADGTRFWALTTLTALRDPNDDLYGFSVVIRDLTEARRLAELSRQTNLQLNATVAEQSDALAKANKDLDVFSYTVAHDLRAPLRHISQFLHLAQEELGDPTDHPALPLVKRASAASRQMAAMIEGLLEYTRIGQVAFSRQEVPFAALVLGISGHLRAEQGKRRIDWQIDPGMPTVSSDPIILGEAIGKLLENAVKFTRSNPEARIEVGVKSTGDGRGVFYVRDNGVGFDLSRAKNLYLMFQRQHHSMDFEGHGMGLALAHRIIERHGGKIWCETSPGQGCCFYFDLPLANPALMRTDITL
jgi:PAS domain S-box-containing protein